MKRFILVLALALTLVTTLFAERVTPETAKSVATTFLSNNGAKASQLTDLSIAAGFPNLYIFTAEQGFVVMSADDCVQPILGYSLTGTFFAEDMPDHVRGWLQGYNDEIQSAIENQMRATEKTSQLWKALAEGKGNVAKANVVVAPLIQTKWNQNKYYNRLCPVISGGPDNHAYVGCAATAMAQIMKYYNYPSKGIGSHSYTWNNQTLSADFGATTYDWANMNDTYEYYYDDNNVSHWISGTPPEQQIIAVATLMYHCGISMDMSYGSGSSNAITAYAADALKTYFNYSPETTYKQKSRTTNMQTHEVIVYYADDVWIAMVKAELDAQRPLEYAGQDPNSNAGHAFVCDGYNDDDYFHFNWGWAGRYNGYFSINNLNTGANNESGSGNGVFTRDQAAIFGIEPVHCAASDPTNLTYSLNGLQEITLSWDASTGAESYNIYRNGSLVGNSATNSYSETAPFGTNVYYVRSVDANGALSLSSNYLNVFIGYQQPIVDDLIATLSGNTVSLSWTAPNWCYPEQPSETLNYGNGTVYYSWTYTCYGHKHLAADLAPYRNMVVYKVGTLVKYPGTYSVYVYTGTNNYDRPAVLATSKVGVEVSVSNSWYDFDLDIPVILTGEEDLWVVMKQENTGQSNPVPSFNLSEYNINAFYGGSSPSNIYGGNSSYKCAWFINTYLTDGTYTYNLYDGSSQVASDINTTNYTVNNVANNAAHLYTLKTNYYGGETDASNMAGLALGNVSLASLSMAANDKMTVTEGSVLTVRGAISNSVAANLIIDDGAQLVSGPVAGTMLKDIDGYTDVHNNHEGYYLIASPVDGIQPTNVTNMVNGTYDLYAWDPTESYEWRNYKAQGNFTTLDAGVGYLYANIDTTTLEFAGQLNANFQGFNSLNYDANDELHSLNLVGNPYAHQYEISMANNGSWVSSPTYLTLNALGDGFLTNVSSNGKIVLDPMQAVLVLATAEGEILAEYSDIPPIGDGGEIFLNKASGIVNIKVQYSDGLVADNAIVRFDEGGMMRKLYLSNNSTRLYIPRGNDEMAIVCSNNEGVLPINFKAAKNGVYTLSIENDNLDLNYLHLIDNMTGADVDLLETSSYNFEARTTDYASRFKLVFSNSEDTASSGSAAFAYVNDGEIVMVETCPGASLQVIDMTGRIVVFGDAMNSVSTRGMTPGVYVLRLITADGVKTQKIVIE